MTGRVIIWLARARQWAVERASALSGRERLAIAGGAALIFVLALHSLVWQPLQEGREAARQRIASLDQAIGLAKAAGPALAQRPTYSAAEAPATRITRTASEAGLNIRRLEPDGDGFSVSLDQVPFDTLINWLADIEHAGELTVSGVDLERQPTPGVVSARIRIRRAT
jgi:general secretion pathway protein M